MIQEARDGHDVVEWLAKQPYCNGKVTMWGGSYAGHNQWVTAREFPPHLATIVPVASPYAGIDFPMRGNIASPYLMQWLTFTSGRASQDRIFGDDAFWRAKSREWFETGAPFKQFDELLGNPSPTFQEWVAHPSIDEYWDGYNPTGEQYAKMSIPILTITGSYDGDQPGALEYWQYDTFFTRFDDETIEPAHVTFALDAEGKIERVTLKAVSPLADFSYDYHDLLFKPAKQ